MTYAFTIEPTAYSAFEDEAAQIEKCKEWGLLSEKASKIKTFSYKGNGRNLTCSIIGYVDDMTAVIEFDNKQKHSIHPSYLKEMQASAYSQRLVAATEQPADQENEPAAEVKNENPGVDVPEVVSPKADELPKAAAKKEKVPKFELPEEKVKMIATVKEFTTVPNNFADNDDEVVIYEPVSILEPDTEVGTAWSSHSTTLKKLELAIGDTITFEAKLVKKKLTRHPVPYKINNPSKIQKQS